LPARPEHSRREAERRASIPRVRATFPRAAPTIAGAARAFLARSRARGEHPLVRATFAFGGPDATATRRRLRTRPPPANPQPGNLKLIMARCQVKHGVSLGSSVCRQQRAMINCDAGAGAAVGRSQSSHIMIM
jgi:hypothetical protein